MDSAWGTLGVVLAGLGALYGLWVFLGRQRRNLENARLKADALEIENARLEEEKKAQSMAVHSQLLRINDLLRDRERLRESIRKRVSDK